MKKSLKQQKNKPLWLHLGCGKRDFPGFTNVDLAKFPHINYQRPVDDLKPFKNNSVDLIYSSHVFEYFDKFEAIKTLKEWRRVLKKGGILRLAVPDFEAMAKVYTKYKKLELITGPLYGRWPIVGTNKIAYHKIVYDFRTLKKIFEENGFFKIKRYDWRKRSSHKDFDDHSQAYIPHMDKEKGILISLNVEAIKK